MDAKEEATDPHAVYTGRKGVQVYGRSASTSFAGSLQPPTLVSSEKCKGVDFPPEWDQRPGSLGTGRKVTGRPVCTSELRSRS